MKIQKLKDFSPEEHKTWNVLFNNLEHCRVHQAHPIFEEGIRKLDMDANTIPSLKEINKKLSTLTGWNGVLVEGLEDDTNFFTALKNKQFPIGNFLRDAKDVNYTPAPDIFHDMYGHLPLFANEEYADFCHRFGISACKHLNKPEVLSEYSRLFWFGVEFPIIKTPKGNRIFGGGILSSFGESNYCLSDEPELIPFDPEIIRNLPYKIDEFQKKIFILDDEHHLYDCLDLFEANCR